MRRLLDRIHDPAVRAALDRLVEELQAKHSTVYEMLQRMDTKRDGILSRDEVRRGLSGLGVKLRTSELDSARAAMSRSRSARAASLTTSLKFAPGEAMRRLESGLHAAV